MEDANDDDVHLNSPEWKLIQLIRERPCLYDRYSDGYRKTMKKERAWYEITKALNMTVHDCQRAWRNLRDYYSRERRVEERTGMISTWRNYEAMHFLKPFTQRRRPGLRSKFKNPDASSSSSNQDERSQSQSSNNANTTPAKANDSLFEFLSFPDTSTHHTVVVTSDANMKQQNATYETFSPPRSESPGTADDIAAENKVDKMASFSTLAQYGTNTNATSAAELFCQSMGKRMNNMSDYDQLVFQTIVSKVLMMNADERKKLNKTIV